MNQPPSDRSPLARYVQSLRARRGFSVDFVATRAKVGIVDYIQFEQAPEHTPLSVCWEIFQALDVSDDEFVDFQVLAKLVLEKTPKSLSDIRQNTPVFASEPETAPNCVSLWGKRDLPPPIDPKSDQEGDGDK